MRTIKDVRIKPGDVRIKPGEERNFVISSDELVVHLFYDAAGEQVPKHKTTEQLLAAMNPNVRGTLYKLANSALRFFMAKVEEGGIGQASMQPMPSGRLK